MTEPGVAPESTRVWGRFAASTFAIALLASAVSGCAGGTSGNPRSLLSSARATLDSTSAAHFTLSNTNASSGGTTITGGEGDVQRPDKLKGSLDVIVNGFKAQVKVVAVGDQVFAQLPFSTSFSKIDPATFGLGNPGQLLDPQKGLSSLLTAATGAKVTGQQRINGELVDLVSADVPGSAVPVLPDADPSVAVHLVAAINPDNHELRQVTLSGPFIKAGTESTFVLTLTSYGENVQITPPSGG